MHKVFDRPLFLGKKVIFLPQCHSTSEELINIVRDSKEPEGFIVYSDHQQKGRGQRGNLWLDERGKNILMSILLRPWSILPEEQFFLNLITSLSIADTLEGILRCRPQLKWPNDVYFGGKKISGVLIEGDIRGNKIKFCVVGIGLNVNQGSFEIPIATSLYIETGRCFEREEIMESILVHMEKWYLKLKNGVKEEILECYQSILMWRGEKRLFRFCDREFEGEILGIDKNGNLEIMIKGKLTTFTIKEIEFVR